VERAKSDNGKDVGGLRSSWGRYPGGETRGETVLETLVRYGADGSFEGGGHLPREVGGTLEGVIVFLGKQCRAVSVVDGDRK